MKVLGAKKDLEELIVGEHVRVSNLTKKSVRKLQARKAYYQNWSKSIYRVFRIMRNKHVEEQYQLKNKNNQVKKRLYFRHELLISSGRC